MSTERRRVVVTGLGMMSPCGLSVSENWNSLTHGKSGIGPVTQFDVSNYGTKIAGEVKAFDLDAFVAKKEQKKMDRFIHLALASAKMAVEDSGLEFSEDLGSRSGSLFGVGIGGLPMIERQHSVLLERGPSRVTPFFIPAVITNLTSGQLGILYGLKGPNYAVTSACASGAHAIGESAKYIMDGTCDVMITGGSESVICSMAIGGFGAMKALSTRNDEPEKASRPWDKDRDGFVLSEGSAVLILEELEHAKKRGATIYGEVSGFGLSCDAYHLTSPSPGGDGAARSMKMALKSAGLSPNQVDYINAHGTSTPQGDEVETAAVKQVFGDHSKDLWVSSTKSMTGHTLGAAGAIESVISLMALKTGIVPPTINLENPSEDCDLDYVPNTAREKNLNFVLNNSFGFGGTNCTLLFGKV
ncbi:beta-ketoacyl-ACP synthase II [bacterium]|nr:beta-ketoacyl-ACP synthase II [bacterium]